MAPPSSLEAVIAAAPETWFQAYLPGETGKIEALIDRVDRAGVKSLVLTVDTAVLANRENNVRAAFSTPLRPSLGLAWEGLMHPRWSVGTFLRTIVTHGMPHFENSYATRGAPILSSRVARDFGAKDHLDWEHLALIRLKWTHTLVVKGIMNHEDARKVRDLGADGLKQASGWRQEQRLGTQSPLRTCRRFGPQDQPGALLLSRSYFANHVGRQAGPSTVLQTRHRSRFAEIPFLPPRHGLSGCCHARILAA